VRYPEGVDKAELLQAMKEGRLRWEGAVTRVPKERREEPSFEGGWSLKDVIAHLSEWEGVAATRLEFSMGRSATGPDFEDLEIDERNARYYERNRRLPFTKVADAEAANWRRLLAVAESMSDDQLQDRALLKTRPGVEPCDMIAGNAHEHFDEHSEQVHNWLGRD
jgi:hypothetical protein